MKNDMENDKNDINDIRQEIADLKASLQALGDAKTAGETLSAGEILRIYERLNKLEASAETVADNERDKLDGEDDKPDKEDDKPDIERNKPDPRQVSAMVPDITQAGNIQTSIPAKHEQKNNQKENNQKENNPARSEQGDEQANRVLDAQADSHSEEKALSDNHTGNMPANERAGNKKNENENKKNEINNNKNKNEELDIDPEMVQQGTLPQLEAGQERDDLNPGTAQEENSGMAQQGDAGTIQQEDTGTVQQEDARTVQQGTSYSNSEMARQGAYPQWIVGQKGNDDISLGTERQENFEAEQQRMPYSNLGIVQQGTSHSNLEIVPQEMPTQCTGEQGRNDLSPGIVQQENSGTVRQGNSEVIQQGTPLHWTTMQKSNVYQRNPQDQQYQQFQQFQQQLNPQNIQDPQNPQYTRLPENNPGMQPLPANGYIPASARGYAAGRIPPAYVIRKQNQSRPSGGISETSVGKYVIGILASILVLLGVATGARTFWKAVPEIVKFVMLLISGTGVAATGYVKARENEQAGGFWPSISATGAAIVFIAITSGMLVWGLYGPILLGIMLFAWFLGSLTLSSGLQSRMFYVVSYIGAILSMTLGMIEVVGMSGGSATIGFAMLAVTMSLAGLSVQKKDRIIPGLNYAFFIATASLCQGVIGQWTRQAKEGYDYAINSFWAAPTYRDVVILICIQLAVAAIAVIESQEIFNGDKIWKKIVMIMAAITSSSVMAAALMQPIPGQESGIIQEGSAAIILLAVLAAIGVFMKLRGKIGLYSVSIAAPGIALLSRIFSEDGPVSPMLLPAAAIIIGAVYMTIAADNNEDGNEGEGDKEYGHEEGAPASGVMRIIGIACYLAYFSALSVFREQNLNHKDLLYILSAVVPMAAAGIVMYRKARLQPIQLCRIEPLLMSLYALRPLNALTKYYYEDGTHITSLLPLAAVVMLFVGNRMLDLQKTEVKQVGWRKTERELTDILYIAILVFMHFSVYLSTVSFFGTRDVTLLEKIATTCALVAMSSAGIYEAVGKKNMVYAILSAISLNINISYIIDLWCEGQYQAILVSVIGIFVATGFILIGFKQKFKPIRVIGLAAMIMYVLKISVFDISLVYSKGINAVLLVLGGIACFAISYVYSRISQKQDDEDD